MENTISIKSKLQLLADKIHFYNAKASHHRYLCGLNLQSNRKLADECYETARIAEMASEMAQAEFKKLSKKYMALRKKEVITV